MIIGGTAPNMNLDNAALEGRMTHDIDKHKKDVYRLSFLLDDETERVNVADSIRNDMMEFISTVRSHEINTKAIANYMGVEQVNQDDFLRKIQIIFGL